MAILFCFTSCSNNSASSGGDGNAGGNSSGGDVTSPSTGGGDTATPSGSPGNSNSDIDHSLGEISEDLKIEATDSSGKKNYSAEENDEGILIKFDIPENTNSYFIYIDGIGEVTQSFNIESKTEDDFFYPFLEPSKEYTVRVQFNNKDKFDSDGYTIDNPDFVKGYFDITAKAGVQSKGEVFLEDFGEIKVEKNGDFMFTKKTAFHNESLLADKWHMEIGLNEGVSWMYPNRRSKWLTQIQIPCKNLGETYNFYTYPRPWGDVTKVDFICYRPIMDYEYGDKPYHYQWDGYLLDTNCKPESELYTDIDITKSADLVKIQGMWTYVWKYEYDWKGEDEEGEGDWEAISCYIVNIATVTIVGDSVTTSYYWTLTKLDGTAFTFTEDELKNKGYELSSDGKTITKKWKPDEGSLKGYKHPYWLDRGNLSECYKTYKLQLFEGGKTLRITQFHKDCGEDDGLCLDYQKQ